ncbi:DUF6879 family protein [Streptomyces phaeochromogenes]|uniref:DUF6879 family protein n=1 Tax=Streptomyces phaeochromogenes TaxID=1923 RepID=UPI0038694CDC|nr:hypothetical protein OG277_06600 [Streptomyces phaeochromogenes]
MARTIRFNGTDSKNGGCPAVHELVGTDEFIVQGLPLTDPDDVAKLRFLGPDDVAVVVPRETLVNHGPKELERVPKLIDLEEFGRLFETFEHTAWRLETRGRYQSDEEDPTYGEFVRTGHFELDTEDEWSQLMRRQTSAGKTAGRVRVVDTPPTVGQLFLLADAPRNAAAGEDMRYLWRHEANARNLPAQDVWIFDSRLVALLRFDDADVLLGAEVITEPAEVNRYMQVRDAAMHGAVAYDRFAEQVASASDE